MMRSIFVNKLHKKPTGGFGWKTRQHISKFSNSTTCDDCRRSRILYFGSDAFSLGPLQHIVARLRKKTSGKCLVEEVRVVVSEAPFLAKEKKKQISNEFIDYIKKEELPIHYWNRDPITKLLGFDYGLVASFGHLIPKKIISSFSRGAINAHPSLLPKWRGAAPIIHTVLNGDRKTGVSIIDLSIGRFDKGRIFAQKDKDIDHTWTNESLTESLSELAGKMMMDVIDDYDHYVANAYQQSEEGASYAQKITKDLSFITWERDSSSYIDRLQRAIGKKIGLHSVFEGKLVKLTDIKVLGSEDCERIELQLGVPFRAGDAWFSKSKKALFIKSKDGWLEVQQLQVEYKKPIRPVDFYNAYMVDRRRKGIVCNHFHSVNDSQ